MFPFCSYVARAWPTSCSASSPEPDAPPFQGGLIGFFGYDLAPLLEHLPRKAEADSTIPDVRFALYDTAVIVDHATGAVVLSAHDLLGEGESATRRRLLRWRDALARPPARPARTRLETAVAGNFSRAGYLDAVGRALEYIRAGNQAQRAGAERAAINAPMQGTAADIIKRAMVAVDGWLAGHASQAKMILQVHDELVFEADAGFATTLVEEAGRLMASAAQLSVPLVVESGVGDNWDEAH